MTASGQSTWTSCSCGKQ